MLIGSSVVWRTATSLSLRWLVGRVFLASGWADDHVFRSYCSLGEPVDFGAYLWAWSKASIDSVSHNLLSSCAGRGFWIIAHDSFIECNRVLFIRSSNEYRPSLIITRGAATCGISAVLCRLLLSEHLSALIIIFTIHSSELLLACVSVPLALSVAYVPRLLLCRHVECYRRPLVFNGAMLTV